MYHDIPMSQRLDRIGEILAKGVYLYAKKEKLTAKNIRLKSNELINKRRKKKLNELQKCANIPLSKET